ncbi:MAG: hypothetical protein JRI36_13045 [Deltaproteobacteria bacterium]|nr:hypothetical protein [Deltaproteobacteria bacterium]
MILPVRVKLKDISEQGKNFKWERPSQCPRCDSVRVWEHGFVTAYFDDFDECLYLRRFRCPDCGCVIRMKPEGYFKRFHAPVDVIRSCLHQRLRCGRWSPLLGKSRQRHWLLALKRKTAAFLGFTHNLLSAFDRLMGMGQIPVSRGI